MSEKKKTSKKKGSLTGEERKHLLKCRLIRLFKPVKRNKIVFSQFHRNFKTVRIAERDYLLYRSLAVGTLTDEVCKVIV